MAVFCMTKPAGILGAGGLVRFVLTLTWWLVPETVICSLTLAGRGVARVAVAGSDIRLLAAFFVVAMCNC